VSESHIKPDFLIIGAQKSGTTWLWEMLGQHPGTSLPTKKEIHFFGSSELYRKGPGWYYEHFDGLDAGLICGEASTSYLFDRVPFWFNDNRALAYDSTLGKIPDLVRRELPDAKIIAVLRDPVHRAISAYRHWMRKGDLPPLAGLQKTATSHPKLRIGEYGHYHQYLRLWCQTFPREQMLFLNFESDVIGDPRRALEKVFRFLGLDDEFEPRQPERHVYRSWSWTRSVVSYYAGPLRRWVNRGGLGTWLDSHDIMEKYALRLGDVEFLREIYLPSKEALETLLDRSLDNWDYGSGLLSSMRRGKGGQRHTGVFL